MTCSFLFWDETGTCLRLEFSAPRQGSKGGGGGGRDGGGSGAGRRYLISPELKQTRKFTGLYNIRREEKPEAVISSSLSPPYPVFCVPRS